VGPRVTSGSDEVAEAAHDLMNLLSVVRSYTELVQREVADPPLADFLAEVQAAVAKATDLAHRLQEIGDGDG
jgi:signal transduction histidine kinase